MNASSNAPAAKQKKASNVFTMEEVAKLNKKGDVWVVLHGRVLNVSNFLSQHPGGELAILTFAGKDASAEFDMIHPPDVIEKYAPDAIIGKLGEGGADDGEDEDDDADAGQDVETGTLKRAKSIRSVPKAKVPAPPKQSNENFCVQLKDDFVWHVSKMDGCT